MQNYLYMADEVRAAFDEFKTKLEPLLARTAQTELDKNIFLVRLERFYPDFYEPFERLYGQHHAFQQQLDLIGELLVDSHAARPADMRLLDLEREITPDWFQRETMVGYITYVDLFAGTLAGVASKLPYLQEA